MNQLRRKEEGYLLNCLLPIIFRLGEAILMILFYLKPGDSRVVPLQFSVILEVLFC